jgi:hypothetical protein
MQVLFCLVFVSPGVIFVISFDYRSCHLSRIISLLFPLVADRGMHHHLPRLRDATAGPADLQQPDVSGPSHPCHAQHRQTAYGAHPAQAGGRRQGSGRPAGPRRRL